jgi:hypothetical protein
MSGSTAEHRRLAQATGRAEDDLFEANPWYEWGPYLSERAWGTVREDYSADGDAWDYFPHDHARSRSYRWNEDAMAGISDIRQELCLGLALWNGVDPILKERMFGLTGPQGNHGEDVKEYWWYLDGLPSHALLRWRYHYPQQEFPYQRLIDENGRRGRNDPEFELLDTGVFDDGRYWIVDVTYAKASPNEVLARITVRNRGDVEANIHVLPTLWFRNTWDWSGGGDAIPSLSLDEGAITVEHERLRGYRLDAAPVGDATPTALFCNNETNTAKLYGVTSTTPYPKDGINDHVVHGADTVDPAQRGTKAAWWYQLTVPAGEEVEIRMRLGPSDHAATTGRPDTAGGETEPVTTEWYGAAFDGVLAQRHADADEFYASLAPYVTDPEVQRVLRQASAGLIWSKQLYPYDVARWLDGDPGQPPPPGGHRMGRNSGWRHLDSFDILSMPDPWEYPWFAAWDLAFHTIPWAHLDPAFAKYQLVVLLREWFLHPNGAIPAYEWSFDDVNPPVHPLAAIAVFMIDGAEDREFLERVFQKLLLNFTWWLNRQDPDGNNIFGGGFLGLDNISPVDRSHLPEGWHIEQADGTAWMAYYSLAMLAFAMYLAEENPVYEDMVVKFLEQFIMITEALDTSGLFDRNDGFCYDHLVDPTGTRRAIRVKTLVGVLPLLPAALLSTQTIDKAQHLHKRFDRLSRQWRIDRDELRRRVRTIDGEQRVLLSLYGADEIVPTLSELFDPEAFLSPHGLRSLSRRHTVPYEVDGMPGARIDYEPAESRTSMYGGNSNWRGPVWFPLNYLLVRTLGQYQAFAGDDFRIEYPTGSGQQMTLSDIAQELSDRLLSIWLPGSDGRRPVYGGTEILQTDPDWKDNLLFFEYFHGDDGAGLGAMHQTGWTALIVDLLVRRPREGDG